MSPLHAARFRQDYWGVRPFDRHGAVLMVAGLSYISTGLTYVFTTPTANRTLALSIALSWFPIQFWGTVFVIIGILAFISSRWPPVTKNWGYMVLTGLSAGWSATYLMGVILEDSPYSNLTGALNWGLLAFLWWAISGFVNPDKTVVVVIKDDRPISDS